MVLDSLVNQLAAWSGRLEHFDDLFRRLFTVFDGIPRDLLIIGRSSGCLNNLINSSGVRLAMSAILCKNDGQR